MVHKIKNLILNKKDFVSGFFLLVFGLFWSTQSFRHPVWADGEPQEGFFPLVSAVIIILLSMLLIVRSILFDIPEKKEIKEIKEKKVASIRRISSYIILLTFYGIFMEILGFFITSILFVFITLKKIENQSWKTTTAVGSISIISIYIIFAYFLGVPLPPGLISFL